MNSWTSGATPGLPGVCGIGVALPISHKLLDYREFVGDSLITQKYLEKFPTNSSILLDISQHLLIIHQFFFLVCGVWVALPLHHTLLDYREFVVHGYYHALRVCGGWVVLPLCHKLKNHVSTHAPQTPGLPGVCGGGVALPIRHKLKRKF